MKTFTVMLGDKIWKRGGKRKHRTFTVEAETEHEARRIALDKFRTEGADWKPAWCEAREAIVNLAGHQ